MNISHFIYLVDGHLGCFNFLDIMNKVAIIIHIQVFVSAYVFKSHVSIYLSKNGIAIIVHLFYYDYPSGWEVISHCGFDFYSLMANILNIITFSCAYWSFLYHS